MSGFLLDVNVLLALAWPNHVHHAAAHAWFRKAQKLGFATCTATELGFVRLSSHPAFTLQHVSPGEARTLLRRLTSLPHYQRWSDPPGGVLGPELDSLFELVLSHGFVTDAWLLATAEARGGKLATFDSPLRKLLPAHVEWIRSGEAP